MADESLRIEVRLVGIEQANRQLLKMRDGLPVKQVDRLTAATNKLSRELKQVSASLSPKKMAEQINEVDRRIKALTNGARTLAAQGKRTWDTQIDAARKYAAQLQRLEVLQSRVARASARTASLSRLATGGAGVQTAISAGVGSAAGALASQTLPSGRTGLTGGVGGAADALSGLGLDFGRTGFARGVGDSAAALARLNVEQGLSNTLTSRGKLALASLGQELSKTKRLLPEISQGFRTMAAAAGVLGGIAVARGILNFARSAQNIERRLSAVSDTSEDLSKNWEIIEAISKQSRTAIDVNAAAYQRISIATERLGISQEHVARLLLTVNKSFAIGGASATEMRNSVLQLTQALGADTLQGDELRTLRESASFLAKVLAEELGEESVGALKRLGAEGKLNARTLSKALLEVSSKVDERFGKLPKTFDETVVELQNSLTKLMQSTQGPLAVLQGVIERLAQGVEIASAGLRLLNAQSKVEAAPRGITAESLRGQSALVEEFQGFSPGTLVGIESRGRVGQDEVSNILQKTAQDEEFERFLRKRLSEVKRIRDYVELRVLASTLTPEQKVRLDQDAAIYRTQEEQISKILTDSTKNRNAALKELEEANDRLSSSLRPGAPTIGGPTIVDPGPSGIGLGFAEPIDPEKFFEAQMEAHRAAMDEYEKQWQRYEAVVSSVFNALDTEWRSFLDTGEASFTRFADAILGDIARMLQQMLIAALVRSFIGGAPINPAQQQLGTSTQLGFESGGPAGALGIINSAFGIGIPSGFGFPGLAMGGHVRPREQYLVGERGPELFSSSVPGTITPSGGFGGGMAPIHLTVINTIGEREFVEVVDRRLDSDEGSGKMLAGLSRKRSQARNLLGK